jgi:anti-anti-sigma factor
MKHTLNLYTKRLTLTTDGDILSSNSDIVRQQIFDLLESAAIRQANWETLELDLKSAKMIDSAGLNLIVAVIRHIKLRGSKLIATIASRDIQRTFLFTRLDKALDLVLV